MNFALPYMSIFSKMKLGLYLWNEIRIYPPNAFFNSRAVLQSVL